MLSPFDRNDLVTYRGDDLAIQLNFADTAGVAINMTGWTIFFTIKHSKSDSDAIAVLKYDMTNIPDPTLGVMTIDIAHTLTDHLTGAYWYDIQLKKADDTIQTITNGSITFLTDTTIRTTAV